MFRFAANMRDERREFGRETLWGRACSMTFSWDLERKEELRGKDDLVGVRGESKRMLVDIRWLKWLAPK